MNKQKALEFTLDRLNSVERFIPRNESETKIQEQTIEYLQYIKSILEV